MGRLWRFLRGEQNRKVLAWLGGGLVVAASGLWGVFVWFAGPPPAGGGGTDGATSVHAPGGVAVGGDVSGSTITVAPAVPPAGQQPAR